MSTSSGSVQFPKSGLSVRAITLVPAFTRVPYRRVALVAAEHPELKIYAVDPGDMNTRLHQEAFPGEDISDRAEPASVDALDEKSVERYVAEVARKAGGIDVSFNAISWEDVQGTPLIEMSLEDFERPVLTAVRFRS